MCWFIVISSKSSTFCSDYAKIACFLELAATGDDALVGIAIVFDLAGSYVSLSLIQDKLDDSRSASLTYGC